MPCCLCQFTKDARQRYTPVRLIEIKNRASPAAVESRVAGPHCLRRIVLGVDDHTVRHWKTCARKNRVREFVPARARRTDQMMDPPTREVRLAEGSRYRQDGIGNIACFGCVI